MSQMSNAFENKLVDFLFRAFTLTIGGSTATWSAAPPLYLALLTAAPDDTKTGGTITEVANANGYARLKLCAGANPVNTEWQPTQGGGGSSASSGTGGATSNVNTLTFAAPTGAGWGTVTHFAIVDSATWGAGNVLFWGSITPKTIGGGDTVQVTAGSLGVTFD